MEVSLPRRPKVYNAELKNMVIPEQFSRKRDLGAQQQTIVNILMILMIHIFGYGLPYLKFYSPKSSTSSLLQFQVVIYDYEA